VPGLDKWGELDIDLVANKKLGRSCQKANIVDRYYPANNLPLDPIGMTRMIYSVISQGWAMKPNMSSPTCWNLWLGLGKISLIVA
jgi:hypothetical protein